MRMPPEAAIRNSEFGMRNWLAAGGMGYGSNFS